MPAQPTRNEQYTEVIDGKPVDIEVYAIGDAVTTKANIRGKVWTFNQYETAASAYAKIKDATTRIDNILHQHGIQRA